MLESLRLPLGERVQVDLSAPIQGVHLWKEEVVSKVPQILVMSILESEIELD